MYVVFYITAVKWEELKLSNNTIHYSYEVDGNDFTRAGEASSDLKSKLKIMGASPAAIRKVSIAMYEGEINMVIHANGGTIDADIFVDHIELVLKDTGPGIPDIELAMKEGYSTAPESINSLGFGAGMGLPNMKRFTDELHVESTVNVGTTVTMRINF